MKRFKILFSKIVFLNAIFLILMSAYRLLFFMYYKKGVDLQGFGADIFSAFYMGTRFDLSVIADINAPVTIAFIFVFIVGKSSWFKSLFNFLRYYYTVFIGLLFIIFCADFNYYNYFHDHLNILIYGFIEDDTAALIRTFYEDYNLFLIGLLIVFAFTVIFLISKIILKIKEDNSVLPNIFLRIFMSIVLVLLVFIMMRGTFRFNPLGVYSDVSSNDFLNKTAINCIFTLQRAIEHKSKYSQRDINYEEKTGYENNIRQAFADFLNKDINDIPKENPENSLVYTTEINKEIDMRQPNVILIVMESFGGDLIKYNSESFNILGGLQKHFNEDIVFYNFTSEGNITITAIEALLLNSVIRPNSYNTPQSQYGYKKYPFAAIIPYKQSGYESLFMYGDNASWRNV
ncbi:MAG: hypothetical protein LBT79_03885, partial [Elusimicrobiota bacterium]|nr:hypothetical protein [Elusimicrobiota bacterium]